MKALHLASARAVRRELEASLVFITHDKQLSLAARASGFEVIGA